MHRSKCICAALIVIFGISTANAQKREAAFVAYSVRVDAAGIATVSIYNPDDKHAACVSPVSWPNGSAANDPFYVFGEDGKAWEFAGLYAEPYGKPKPVRIAPNTSVTVKANIPASYKPRVGNSKKLGKVFFAQNFWKC